MSNPRWLYRVRSRDIHGGGAGGMFVGNRQYRQHRNFRGIEQCFGGAERADHRAAGGHLRRRTVCPRR